MCFAIKVLWHRIQALYSLTASLRSGQRSLSTTSKQAASAMQAEAFVVVRRSAISTANRIFLRCRRLAVRAVLHKKLRTSEDVVENRVRKAPHFKWDECELQRIQAAKLSSKDGIGQTEEQCQEEEAQGVLEACTAVAAHFKLHLRLLHSLDTRGRRGVPEVVRGFISPGGILSRKRTRICSIISVTK